jgi:hypothetical protein
MIHHQRLIKFHIHLKEKKLNLNKNNKMYLKLIK